jgi:hypothetical protein
MWYFFQNKYTTAESTSIYHHCTRLSGQVSKAYTRIRSTGQVRAQPPRSLQSEGVIKQSFQFQSSIRCKQSTQVLAIYPNRWAACTWARAISTGKQKHFDNIFGWLHAGLSSSTWRRAASRSRDEAQDLAPESTAHITGAAEEVEGAANGDRLIALRVQEYRYIPFSCITTVTDWMAGPQ